MEADSAMSSVVRSHHLRDKIGDDGLKEGLNLDPRDDELWRWSEDHQRALVLWHGHSQDIRLIAWLEDTPGAFVLFLGTGPAVVPRVIRDRFGSQVEGLPWGLADLQNWEPHLPWKRRRLKNFVNDWRSRSTGAPLWQLLVPPLLPEHVLACYLCALAGVTVRPDWSSGFEEEVEYWIAERGASVVGPEWHEPFPDQGQLRQFLVDCGIVAPVVFDRQESDELSN